MPTPSPNPKQQQGRQRRRSRSRYAVQLQEKQDLKGIFGIREAQLRRYYEQALRSGAQTGEVLITKLEGRLDNAIYRSGFADTRPQARQMASHRLFTVNGRPVNIPSYPLKPGDVISVRESKRGKSYFANFSKRMQNVKNPSWIELDSDQYTFKITAWPSYEEANLGIDIRAIVESFAR